MNNLFLAEMSLEGAGGVFIPIKLPPVEEIFDTPKNYLVTAILLAFEEGGGHGPWLGKILNVVGIGRFKVLYKQAREIYLSSGIVFQD